MHKKVYGLVIFVALVAVTLTLIIGNYKFLASIPTVETKDAKVIDSNISLIGIINDEGNREIIKCGFKWGTNHNLDNNIEAGLGNLAEGTYEATISKLKSGETYYYQAYAVNNKGTGYGEIKELTIPNQPPTITVFKPTSDITIIHGEVVNISATASDDNSVELLTLLVNGEVIKEVLDNKLDFAWNTNNINIGQHQVKVIASDEHGATDEKSININIKALDLKVIEYTPQSLKPLATPSRSYYPTASNKYPRLSKTNGAFGQFPYRDIAGGRIEIDPKWMEQNIVTITLPGLNSKVQVHKDAAPHFIQAFTYIKNGTVNINGREVPLLSLIKTMDGTFVPRHIGWDISRGLSNHSWGTAIDINAAGHFRYVDPAKEPNNPNLILWEKAFKPAGFSWGNSYGDAMHYEIYK